jgi:long-chain acyl-CoA synthetase
MDRPRREVVGVWWWKQVAETQTDAGQQAIDFFCAKARETRPEDIASILYTSGTMGQPKGVVLTHANFVSNIHSSESLFPLGGLDVGMSLLPLCHVYERMLDFHYFWLGVSIAYPESFEALPENLREVRPTVMAVVPRVLEKIHDKVMERVRQASPIMQKLFHWAFTVGKEYFPYRLQRRIPPLGGRVKNALADALIFSRIRAQLGGRMAVLVSGAAPLSPELAQFFCAIGLPVFEGYGLTETSPVITTNYPGCVKLGTVGRAVEGVEIKLGEKIEDQEGAIGREILVRGPNVTPGYYHLEDENRQAFVDGWFRTGDLGTLDSEGFLTITGRKKNLFKTSGGKFVSPEKLENLFQGHPNVSQIVILGDARKFIGALIVPNFERLEVYARDRGIAFKNHVELVANQEVHHFLQQQVDALNLSLPPHERIRQFLLLPKEFTIASGELSATLKVKRRVVEDRYRDQIEEMFLRHAPVPARN